MPSREVVESLTLPEHKYQRAARSLAFHEQHRAAGIRAQVAGRAEGFQHLGRQATKPLVFPQLAGDTILDNFQPVRGIHGCHHLAHIRFCRFTLRGSRHGSALECAGSWAGNSKFFGLRQQRGRDPRSSALTLQAADKFPSGAGVPCLRHDSPHANRYSGSRPGLIGLARPEFRWPGVSSRAGRARATVLQVSRRPWPRIGNRSEESAEGEGSGSVVPVPLRVAP